MRAFSKQLPLLYLVLLANTAFVSATHFGLAPDLLSLYLPGLFSLLCVARLASWWRMRNANIGHAAAVRRLQSTKYLSGLFGACFTAWGLLLFPYGGPQEQLHVAYFMSITMISCVFCLMHMRAAAYTLAVIVTVPFTIFFATRGEPVMLAIAANMALVAIAMTIVISTHYSDFRRMIRQSTELTAKHRESLALAGENHRLARVDSLTGLANRREFLAGIASEVAAGREMAIGLVDLDGFKAVNDVYGHATGDGLLVEAAIRMTELEGFDVTFARLGGDEFGFMLRPRGGHFDPAAFGRMLALKLGMPYGLAGLNLTVSASAGLAIYPTAGTTAERLVENADYALYQAKSQSPGTAVIFTESHAAEIKRLNLVLHNLRTADLDRDLELAYQPLVALATGKIIGYEALARWHNGQLGHVPPSEFIKAAERSDLINRLSLALFRTALRDMQSWPSNTSLFFNLSARNINATGFALQLTAEIVRAGINPRRIEFEVTETAVMADFDQALQCLSALRGVGCRIALDDFGTGYSSLSHVHRLPLDNIKIDGRFIAGIEDNATVRSIVKSIIDLSHNLGLKCVAEGIETATQASLAAELGCDLAQGFHFGRPAKPDALAESQPSNRWMTAAEP
jgi:diguanylate cyclase (GGDEF)-like protein